MKDLVVAALVALAVGSAPLLAQAPAQPAPKPATPPAAPAQPPAPAPPAPAPRPFPEGAKFAYINIQRVANESAEGKAATAKVKALNDKKVAELGEKNKALQANQDKLSKSGSVLSEAVRGQLEKEIERQQVEIQRYTQDAQAEVQELQQELQGQFQQKLVPIIEAMGREKALQMIFSQIDSGLVWADSALDITADVIKRFDAAKPAGQ
jgi:outer membrane protein